MKTLTFNSEADWLAARKGTTDGEVTISGTDVAAIMGFHPQKGALAVYAEKVGALGSTVDPDAIDIRLGRKLEPVIAELYSEDSGNIVEALPAFTLCVHAENPWAVGTIDRLIHPTRGKTDDGILECKKARGLGDDAEWDSGGPIQYQAQLQWYLYVCDLQWGVLASIIGSGHRFLSIEVERNNEFIAEAVEAAEEFRARVRQRRPPDADSRPLTKRAVKALYPEDSGETIEFPLGQMEWVNNWEASKEREKAAADEREFTQNQIALLMGQATWATLPDGRKLQYKTQVKKPELCKSCGSQVRAESVFRAMRMLKR